MAVQGAISLNRTLHRAERRTSVGDNTGQYKHKGHTPSAKIGIKIPDPAGNRLYPQIIPDTHFREAEWALEQV